MCACVNSVNPNAGGTRRIVAAVCHVDERERERGRQTFVSPLSSSPLFFLLLHLAASTSRRRRDHQRVAESQPRMQCRPRRPFTILSEKRTTTSSSPVSGRRRALSALLSRDPRRTQTCPQFSEVEWNSHPRRFRHPHSPCIPRPGVNRIPRRSGRCGSPVSFSLEH